MAYEKKPGDVVIFKNNRRREGRNDPEYELTLTGLNGETAKAGLWLNTSGKGVKYFRGKFNIDALQSCLGLESDQPQLPGASHQAPAQREDPDEDVPF